MATDSMQFSWRWNDGTISLNLVVIWEMSAKIKAATGERWFFTEAEAIAAGWRKARR